jgi:hypothetical protein
VRGPDGWEDWVHSDWVWVVKGAPNAATGAVGDDVGRRRLQVALNDLSALFAAGGPDADHRGFVKDGAEP